MCELNDKGLVSLSTRVQLWVSNPVSRHNHLDKFGDELTKRTDCNVFSRQHTGATVLPRHLAFVVGGREAAGCACRRGVRNGYLTIK